MAELNQRPHKIDKFRGVKGNNTNKIPAASGPFALPPPKPEFYEEHGLRKVKPYMFAFQSYAKERWQGRTLIDVYSDWVRDRSIEYYEWAIATGAIVVNNETSTPDRILRNGDLLSNVLHRHEPPVVAGPIRIIYDGRLPGNDGETLVVEKPGSMPVHSTGRYNFNTLLSILKYDYDIPLVHTSNRLDRLTSGVMVCALTVEASKKLGAWFGGLRDTGVDKEYVARCVGRFPDGEITCEEPLLTIDRQIGVNVVHPEGRPSKTIFTRMSYHEASNTSVIHCKPITGRSHQIRVHLQFLGHSIANDPIYQNTAAWGESGGKGGVFGAERGGSAEERQRRQDMGDQLMKQRKEAGVGADLTTPVPEGESAVEEQSGQVTPSNEPSSIYNKQGRVRNATLGQVDLDAVANDRKAHDPTLTEGAKVAIAALRVVKDEADGWARQRDLLGIAAAKKSGDGSGLLSAAEKVAAGQEEERVEEVAAEGDEEGNFCKTCFTPLIPDPRPEQLFIWLHAMRYKTTDWDWSSPALPYWAEESYDVPLTSILA